MGIKEKMMNAEGVTRKDFEPKRIEPIEISREDFDLLDVEEEVIYHIVEEDGTITIRKGENK